MTRIVFMLVALFLFPVSISADENESLFLKIYLPRIGVLDLDGVNISIIPSPTVKIPDRSGEVPVISDDNEKTRKEYTKSGWEVVIKRRWLRLGFKKEATLMIVFQQMPTVQPGYSYIIYVSPVPERTISFGRLVGPDLIDVLFTYYTINIVFSESEKVERMRTHFLELAAAKKPIKLRGRIVRIETNALHLFDRETRIIDFLDFYISDVEFLN